MSQKKQIFKLNILKKLLTDANSCVSLVKSTRLLALPPLFLTDMKSGILYLLNSMLKKYDRSLGGIVIGYQNIKVLMDENTGIIPIGTSEMEVNVSVEFYIFQPKIGSYLEGVINKKSNNHIGCLVHQYFNATILKAEDVLYEDWICKDLNVDDKIIFKVIDLDFTTLLPYIEGIYDGRISLGKVESKLSGNCDLENVISGNVNSSTNEASISKEFLKGRTNLDETSETDILDSKKGKGKCELEDEFNKVDVSSNLDESRSFTDLGIKKKKKKKEQLSTLDTDIFKGNEEKKSNYEDLIADMINKKLKEDESPKKKKKKKRKKENESNDCMEVEKNEKKEDSTLLPFQFHEKHLEIEDENSNDFVKSIKSKKEKKNKNESEEPFPSFNKTNECLSLQEMEDNVLYSTQLEPDIGSKKMRISFCSPIPQGNPFEDKSEKAAKIASAVHLNNDNADTTEKEKKKKHKKRKREKEEELQNSPATKRMKLTNTPSSNKEEAKLEVNGNERKSLVQLMMEQLCQQELNRVRGELNMSSSDKEEKKKKKKKKKRETEPTELHKDTKSELNGEDIKSDLQSTFEHLWRQELQKVKEEMSISDKESIKETKKKKSKVKKQEKEAPKETIREESYKVKEKKNAQINCTHESEKNFDVQSMMHELYKQEISRMKKELNKSYTDKIKEKKKKKSMTNTQEAPKEMPHDSLYDKLLNAAKSSMDLDKVPSSIPRLEGESGRKKKDIELSDFSTSASRKKDSKKKHKQKIEDCQLPSAKYKNGSMYDVAPTPEKINPDKSLFSDSEQSHSSPVKKKKVVSGVEVESGRSSVQNMLEEFYKEEIKRLKNESDAESRKTSEKNTKKKHKTKEKFQPPSEKEKSLYEKLMKQAKNLVDARDASLHMKKEKKEKKSKRGVVGLC